jgi:hypothetical protein
MGVAFSRGWVVGGTEVYSAKAHSRGMNVTGDRGRGSGISFFPCAIRLAPLPKSGEAGPSGGVVVESLGGTPVSEGR